MSGTLRSIARILAVATWFTLSTPLSLLLSLALPSTVTAREIRNRLSADHDPVFAWIEYLRLLAFMRMVMSIVIVLEASMRLQQLVHDMAWQARHVARRCTQQARDFRVMFKTTVLTPSFVASTCR